MPSRPRLPSLPGSARARRCGRRRSRTRDAVSDPCGQEGSQAHLESARHPELIEVRLATDNSKWMVDPRTGLAVQVEQRPAQVPVEDIDANLAAACGQKMRKKGSLSVYDIALGTNICVAGALGHPMGTHCACHLLPPKHQVCHSAVQQHVDAPRVAETVYQELPHTRPPKQSAVQALTRAESRAIRDRNMAGKQRPSVKETKSLQERLFGVMAFWAKHIEFAHSWVAGLDNEGFRSYMERALSDATNTEDRPKRLKGIIEMLNKLLHEVPVTAEEKADVEAVLKQWPCARNMHSRLDENGFRKVSHERPCTDGHCGFAHFEHLFDPNDRCLVQEFGIELGGTRRLYHAGLEDMLRNVPPAIRVSQDALFKHLDKHVQKALCRVVRTVPHPALVTPKLVPDPAAARRAAAEKARVENEKGFSLAVPAEAKASIAAAYSPSALFDRDVCEVTEHSRVGALMARVNSKRAKKGCDPLDKDGFRAWVEAKLERDDGDSWLLQTREALDMLQQQADEKAAAKEKSRRMVQERKEDTQRLREAAAAARAEREAAAMGRR